MDKIHDNGEFRRKWEVVHFLEESLKELMPNTYKEYLTGKVQVQELKQSLREYSHRKSDRKYFGESEYGYYKLLIELPEHLKSKEDAEEYFKENEFMTCKPSQYDCTGQHFTLRYKIFKRNGKFMAYHECGVDV